MFITYIKAKTILLFLPKIPSQMFHRVLNTPLINNNREFIEVTTKGAL